MQKNQKDINFNSIDLKNNSFIIEIPFCNIDYSNNITCCSTSINCNKSISSYTKSNYNCYIDSDFNLINNNNKNNLNSIDNNNDEKYVEIENYPCCYPNCQYKFNKLKDLKIHNRIQHNTNYFICRGCNNRFIMYAFYKMHSCSYNDNESELKVFYDKFNFN